MGNSKYGIEHSKFLPVLFTFLIWHFLLATGAPAQPSSGGSFTLEKNVVSGGGGQSAGGGFAFAGTAGQNAAGAVLQNAGFSLAGGFWTADQLVPTSASVSISGKITTANGSGIRNVRVSLTDPQGGLQTTVTGSFGAYRFTGVEVGRTYILEVQSKKYFFAAPVRVVTVSDELTDLNFISEI